MTALMGAIFFFILAVVLAAISLGAKFVEQHRKKQVKTVLDVVSGVKTSEAAPHVLRDVAKPTAIEDAIAGMPVDRKLRSIIQQAGAESTVPKLIGSMLIFGCFGAVIGYLIPVFLFRSITALVFCTVFTFMPLLLLLRKRRKRLSAFEEQFPEALDFLARSMRAGHAFSISLEMLGQESPDPVGQEIRLLFNELNLGAPLEASFESFTKRVPLLDVRFFVSSVLLQRQTGGNLSEILVRLSYIIRERFRLKGQVKAASAHGRITATILTILPLATALILLVIAPDYLRGLAEDPDGKWLLVSAVCAQALGYYFMRRIINIKV